MEIDALTMTGFSYTTKCVQERNKPRCDCNCTITFVALERFIVLDVVFTELRNRSWRPAST